MTPAAQASTIIPLPERKRHRDEWPAERVAELRVLFDRGLSQALIAREMGLSKGAVSGKLDRLGWERPRTALSIPRRMPRKVKPTPTAPPPAPRPSINGQALRVGGNRADTLIRRLDWLDRPLPWEKQA